MRGEGDKRHRTDRLSPLQTDLENSEESSGTSMKASLISDPQTDETHQQHRTLHVCWSFSIFFFILIVLVDVVIVINCYDVKVRMCMYACAVC